MSATKSRTTKSTKTTKAEQKSIDASIRKGMKEARATVAKNLAAIATKDAAEGAPAPEAKADSKGSAKAKAAKASKTSKAAAEKKPRRLSALDAAVKVLGAAKAPMTSGELIVAMAERKLWTSPNGKTPEQTLYAAIVREIKAKGRDARFTKVERGHFAATGKGG